MRSSFSSPSVFCGLLSLLLPALALQANLAGIVDWHKPSMGEPLLEPSPPALVDTSAGRGVISITKSNVISVLGAEKGDIGVWSDEAKMKLKSVWRYKLEDADPVVSYHVHGHCKSCHAPSRPSLTIAVLLLSGPSGSTARLFSLNSGQVKWERLLHNTTTAHLTVPVHLGTDVGFSDDGSYVVILSDGRRITKLALKDGQMQWGLEAPGAGYVAFRALLLQSDQVEDSSSPQ